MTKFRDCKKCPLEKGEPYCIFPHCCGGWRAYAEFLEDQIMSLPVRTDEWYENHDPYNLQVKP